MIENIYPKIAGENLRKLIKEHYDSQDEFAFNYGADVRTISRYINQGIDSINTIENLAKHFGIKFGDFFKESDNIGLQNITKGGE